MLIFINGLMADRLQVNFGEKNHAKVFHIINGKVVLWKPVSEFILFEYEKIK